MADLNEFGYSPEEWKALGGRKRYRIRHKEELKLKRREYNQRPEAKCKRNERNREYRKTETGRAAHNAGTRRYKQRRRDARDDLKEQERARRQALAPKWEAENRTAFEAEPKASLRRVYKGIPSSYHLDVRDDVAQEIAVALLEGELQLSEVKQFAGDFIKAHFRARAWHMTVTFETPVDGSDDLRLIDTLPSECAWH